MYITPSATLSHRRCYISTIILHSRIFKKCNILDGTEGVFTTGSRAKSEGPNCTNFTPLRNENKQIQSGSMNKKLKMIPKPPDSS